jgi:hypothetical protein
MILYDQDFKFIGMSAETLTFLGYENIDEFTSMHTDFADLFIKKEGFIHKFENFSWIHYVLYSGAANKKAYVSRKNGSEICVDITIKEVFLNHTYDGLRMIYSVKLINENFTHISQSDVHDQRSAKKSEFSLNSLTKDLDMSAPKENEIEEKTEPAIQQEPAPLDFKLDIPEDSFLETAEKEDVSETKPDFPDLLSIAENEPEEPSFKLNFPEPEMREEEAPVHIDFDLSKTEENSPETETDTHEEPKFTLDFPVEEEPKNEMHIDFASEQQEEVSKEIEEENQPLFKTDFTLETVSTEKVEDETTVEKDIFSFKLLKDEEKVSEETQTQTSTETPVAETIFPKVEEEKDEHIFVQKEEEPLSQPQEDTPKQEDAPQIFSFNLFSEDQTKEKEDASAPTQTIADSETKSSLISQIKSDIEEIDQEIPVASNEKEDASQKLQALLRQNMETPEDKAEVEEKKQPQETESGLFSFKLYNNNTEEEKTATFSEAEETPPQTEPEVKEISVEPDEQEKLHIYEENSFEETLKNIFSIAPEKDDEKETNLVEPDKDNKEEEAKQNITEEYIESRNQNDVTSEEKLEMPQLGNLGLSKEEELDFIEEFLDDTIATVGLMQEYLQLEDYNNIKYNLIKISSSAEILRFNQMLTYTKELAEVCDAHQKDAAEMKLQALLHLTRRYKEHFSTMPV